MTGTLPNWFVWRRQDSVVYGFAATAVAAATMLRFVGHPVFGDAAPYIMYILPIMAAAAYGGFSCGLFTTIVSTLVIVSVFLRGNVLPFPDAVYLFLFLLDGLYISWLGEQMRLAMRSADRADGEVRSAREREAAILNSISDGFGSLDENWQFVHANEQFARLTGHSLAGLLGKRLQDVWPELAQGFSAGEFRRALQDRIAVSIEVALCNTDRWYEVKAYPQHSGMSIFTRDITDRKRSAQLLRESEERLRMASEAARIGTWTFDLARHQVTWSAELEQTFGTTSPDLAGGDAAFWEIVHADDRDRLRDAVARAVVQGSRFDVEFRYRHGSGEYRWMLGRGSADYDQAGIPTRLLGIGMDITDQKCHEEKLRHTQRLESLGILAGGIAHDFNNLLMGITGNACLALDSLPVGHPAREQLEEVNFAVERASGLTRQMLAYAGKGKFERKALNLSTLIRDTERLVYASIPRSVDLRLDLHAGLPCLEGDAGQVQQVVMNLVINAAEAIPSDRPGMVLVRTGVQSLSEPLNGTQLVSPNFAPGDFVFIEVHDTGVGMDENTLSRIFEPFFTTKSIGRGLGLSATAGIVRGHQGLLKISSIAGKGTTFQVFFPALSTVQTAARPAGEAVHGGISVLLVDAGASGRKATQSMLQQCGYSVLAAEDVGSAIDLLESTPGTVSLALLDVSEPAMDAAEAVTAIHRCRPAMRVIVSGDGAAMEAMSPLPGTSGYIQKPYSLELLAHTVQTALKDEAVLEADGFNSLRLVERAPAAEGAKNIRPAAAPILSKAS